MYVRCADVKKKFVRDYVIKQGYYSYNAADELSDPVQRWIGREVKRFLAESHVHLPVLLRAASAPPDLIETVCNASRDDGKRTSLLAWLSCFYVLVCT